MKKTGGKMVIGLMSFALLLTALLIGNRIYRGTYEELLFLVPATVLQGLVICTEIINNKKK